jgi:hypothetical protein
MDLFHHRSSQVVKRYFLLNEWEWYFFIERDEIDRKRYFSKIPSHSFEWDGISQKLNLAHAWSPLRESRFIKMLYFEIANLL